MGRKVLLTVGFLAALWVIGSVLRWIAGKFGGDRQTTAFWSRQATKIILFALGVLGFVSIWFDNPSRLAAGARLVGAGLAFAMQKVVTSFAGYVVMLRGKTFNIGDRITMGGVRGDVIALNFIQTVIMEMGQPPTVQNDDPGMWVHGRQYSGRIVTISNAEIFEQPVYNYTRDFPYMWEEMQQIHPRVFLRMTDNWVELAVRFLCGTHDIRALKDRISREILTNLDAAKIGIASTTYEIVGLPKIKLDAPLPAMDQRPNSVADGQ
jgi:hypothetical protein